ncbi:putative bifunctional diguanylate cyclase/phosphodiesterase [Agaribacterium haliotis]|uniref:putative bifunctional diguanylate cyclase/phosphodiesterase n=1 Tax=Agaribacterium haliotis TaxID=2013869 RepID=UPI001304526A|nr:EAL domain-containing protein [Agaribacterium haliotis]
MKLRLNLKLKRVSLQLKALVFIVVLSTVFFALTQIMISKDVAKLVDSSIREQLKLTSHSLLYEFETRKQQHQTLLEQISSDELIQRFFKSQNEAQRSLLYRSVADYFKTLLDLNEHIIDLALVLPDGREQLRVSSGPINKSTIDRSFLMSDVLLGRDVQAYEVRWNDDVNAYSFFLYKKIVLDRDATDDASAVNTEAVALVRVAVKAQAMLDSELLASLNENIALGVVNSTGNFFVNVGLDRIPTSLLGRIHDQFFVDENLYVSAIKLSDKWQLVTVFDTDKGDVQLKSITDRTRLMLMLFFFAAVVLGYFLLDVYIIRPIASLNDAVRALSRGEAVPLLSRGSGEIEQLRKSFIGMRRNIIQQKDLLQRQVNTDALTGLPNRHALSLLLEGDLAYADEHGQVVALLFMDLDGFKQVNDVYGHDAGDELLRQVAKRLSSLLRPTDRLGRSGQGPENALIRLGGDEFTIILPSIQNADNAAMVANRLVRQFREQFSVFGNQLFVGASIGIAMFPKDAGDAKDLISHADTAMYAAKQAGKMRFSFYDNTMLEQDLANVHIDTLLHNALENEQIYVHFQPKVDPVDNSCICFEALARMFVPDKGSISPAIFIPAAEKNGLIDRLTLSIFRASCHLLLALKAQGLNGMSCAVNISPGQLANKDLFKKIIDIIVSNDLMPHEFELEITESSLINDEEASQRAIRYLQDLGFSVALDDFGVGYSSLSHLKNFSFNTLKIDRIFFKDLEIDNVSKAILHAIIGLARQLRMTIVAEGIEDDYQLEFVRRQQVHLIQGYIYSKPLPPKDAVQFALEHRSIAKAGKRGPDTD